MKTEMYWDITIKDKHGKVTKRIHKKANSYVQNMINILAVQMRSATATITDNTNVARSVPVGSDAFESVPSTSINTRGIQVGTGTAAVAIGDIQLGTLIADGAGAGQLSHSGVTSTAPATVGATRRFTLVRTFTNNSGGSITVNEVGISCFAGAGIGNFLIERTLLTFAIPNLGNATITYTISVTV